MRKALSKASVQITSPSFFVQKPNQFPVPFTVSTYTLGHITCNENWKSCGSILNLEADQTVQVVRVIPWDDITLVVGKHFYHSCFLTAIQEMLLIMHILMWPAWRQKLCFMFWDGQCSVTLLDSVIKHWKQIWCIYQFSTFFCVHSMLKREQTCTMSWST